MVDAPDPTARRRRRRATAEQGPPTPEPAAPVEVAQTEPPRKRPDNADRALRDLVGGGSSQLGVGAALRARDVNRPTDDDLAEAERDTVIVRRHWKPPAS